MILLFLAILGTAVWPVRLSAASAISLPAQEHLSHSGLVPWAPRDTLLSSRLRQMARSVDTGTILISGEAPSLLTTASSAAPDGPAYAGTCFYIDSVSVTKGTTCPTDLRTTTSFGRWIYFIESPPGSGIDKPNCRVRLTVRAIQLDGGHNHSSTRPAGVPFDTTGNTGFDGDQFRIAHRWPQVGGPLEIRFWCLDDSCGSTDSSQVDFVYCLEAAPLVPPAACPPCSGTPFNTPAIPFSLMAASAAYDLVGTTGEHPVNHYGLAAMQSALAATAGAWNAKFPGSTKKLAFNDQSLIYGGVFDLHQDWKSPGHCGHRAGMECDFRTQHLGAALPIPPPPESRYLREAFFLLKQNHFTIGPEKGGPGGTKPHWHLKYYGHGTFRGPGSTLTTEPVIP